MSTKNRSSMSDLSQYYLKSDPVTGRTISRHPIYGFCLWRGVNYNLRPNRFCQLADNEWLNIDNGMIYTTLRDYILSFGTRPHVADIAITQFENL